MSARREMLGAVGWAACIAGLLLAGGKPHQKLWCHRELALSF